MPWLCLYTVTGKKAFFFFKKNTFSIFPSTVFWYGLQVPLSTETFVPDRDSCCCTPPRVPACGFFLLHAEDFLLCPLLLFAEVKMQAWCLKGFVGTNPLLFGLQACTQVLLIVRTGGSDQILQISQSLIFRDSVILNTLDALLIKIWLERSLP